MLKENNIEITEQGDIIFQVGDIIEYLEYGKIVRAKVVEISNMDENGRLTQFLYLKVTHVDNWPDTYLTMIDSTEFNPVKIEGKRREIKINELAKDLPKFNYSIIKKIFNCLVNYLTIKLRKSNIKL